MAVAPKCKTCNHRHWSWERHRFKEISTAADIIVTAERLDWLRAIEGHTSNSPKSSPNTSPNMRYRAKNQETHREYMRAYMKRRRDV